MAGAQDQAFAALVTSRGLVSTEDLVRSGAARSNEPLAQALARRRLVPAASIAGLLRELAQTPFSCQGCNAHFSYDSLARLERLRCPGCDQAITASRPRSSVSWPAVNAGDSHKGPPSGVGVNHFTPGAHRESGAGSVQLGPDGTYRDGDQGTPPAPGRRLGPYTLIELLGRGSYGAVFLAKREGLERRFALKVLLDSEIADDETIARFKLEAAVASKIDHPGALGVFDVGRDGDHLYYVMEYCPGQDLKQHLRETHKLSPTDAATLIRHVAQTMIATHAKGVIHRDLKPSNIILDETSGRPRVTDFGLARDHSLLRSMTQSGDILGTPHYMSPEQFRGERDLDHRIDIYALGVILYECLTGERPHNAETPMAMADKVCTQPPRHPCDIDPTIPADLAAICLKAMEIHPDDRYPTAVELVADLERHLRGEQPAATRQRSVLPLMVVGGVVSLTFIAVAVALALRDRPEPIETPPPPPVSPVSNTHPARHLLDRIRLRAAQRAPWSKLAPDLAQAADLAEGDDALRAEVDLITVRLLLHRGRPQEALALARELSKTGTALALEARALLGLGCERANRLAEALEVYRALIELDGQGTRGLCAKAALLRREGEHEKAVKAAKQALGRSPDDVLSLIEHGLGMLELNDLDAAEQSLSRAKELAPDDPRVLHGLGRLRLQESKPDSGCRVLETALTLLGDEAASDTRTLYGLCLAKGERPADARQIFDQLLERDGGYVPALVHRGVLLDAAGEVKSAAKDWSRAYGANAMLCQQLLARWYPEEVAQRFNRTVIGDARPVADQRDEFFQLGTIREPVVKLHFRDRLEGLQKFAKADLEKAILRAARGEGWSSLEHPLHSAMRISKKDPRVQLERARLLVARDRHEEAEEALAGVRESLTSSPGSIPSEELAWLKAELVLRRGELGKALDLFERLARDADSTALGPAAKAQALWIIGQYADALAASDMALARSPYHVPSLALRSMSLYALGRPQEAIEPLRAAYERVGAMDSRLLALRAVLILEFRNSSATNNVWGFALEYGADVARVMKHLTISDGTYCQRLAGQLALYSSQTEPRQRAGELLSELNRTEPRQPHTLLALGYSALLAGETSQATRLWHEARRASPSLPFPAPYLERLEAAGGKAADLKAFRRR